MKATKNTQLSTSEKETLVRAAPIVTADDGGSNAFWNEVEARDALRQSNEKALVEPRKTR